MRNYYMELMKYLAKGVKAKEYVTNFPVNKTLCQDLLFRISKQYEAVGNMCFSYKFFYDFYKIDNVNYDEIFVIDGVSALHKRYGGDYPLNKCRSLHLFLYTNHSDVAVDYASAIRDNPWLENLGSSNYTTLSHRAGVALKIVNDFMSEITNAITEHVSNEDFTPRGVWGLDAIMRLKVDFRRTPIYSLGNFEMVPIEEYLATFNNEEE